MTSKSKNDKVVILSSSVMTEKCSKKDFIINSEMFLNTIGVGIYLWIGKNKENNGEVLGSVNENLEKIIEIFGEENLCRLYSVLTSNPRLKNLPHHKYEFGKIPRYNYRVYYLTKDGHHNKYSGNTLKDICGENRIFYIYCMSRKISKSTGYSDKNIHF